MSFAVIPPLIFCVKKSVLSIKNVEKDLTEKAKIEAERLWIEEVYERKKLKEAERKKQIPELIPESAKRLPNIEATTENRTKLGNIFGVNGKYIQDAKRLKETNLAK
jgi:hypothetical protein